MKIPDPDISLNFSINLLGSRETHDILMTDMLELMDTSEEEGLKLMYIVLGPLFLDISICSALKTENNVYDEEWSFYASEYRDDLAEAYRAFRTQVLTQIDNSTNGKNDKVFDKIPHKIKVFFDPDESYVSLVACDPKTKAKPDENCTKDGFRIVNLQLPESEILTDYKDLVKFQ